MSFGKLESSSPDVKKTKPAPSIGYTFMSATCCLLLLDWWSGIRCLMTQAREAKCLTPTNKRKPLRGRDANQLRRD